VPAQSERLFIALAIAINTGLALGLANAHDASEEPKAGEHAGRRAEASSRPLPKAAYRNVSDITAEKPPGRNPRIAATTS
jgi:hypothetical protein